MVVEEWCESWPVIPKTDRKAMAVTIPVINTPMMISGKLFPD
jgi:hypothetical protein